MSLAETPNQREIRLQAALIADVERILFRKELDANFKGVMKKALELERGRLEHLKTKVVQVKIITDKLKAFGIEKGAVLTADVMAGSAVFVFIDNEDKTRINLYLYEYELISNSHN